MKTKSNLVMYQNLIGTPMKKYNLMGSGVPIGRTAIRTSKKFLNRNIYA